MFLALGSFLFSVSSWIPGAQCDDWRFCYPLPQGNTLHAAWSAGPNDHFVGGDGGVIMRWNGSDWTIMDTPTEKSIFSIAGTSPTDIWAVGGDEKTLSDTERSLVMHFDGTQWSHVTPPDFFGSTYVLKGLTAIAPNNVWATVNGGPSLVHWNGTSWQFDLIGGSFFLEGRFYATFALGEDHVFAVGTHGQIIHRYDNTWHLEQKTQEGGFTTDILSGIWGTDLNNLYACGNWGQVYKRNPDGTWQDMPEVFPASLGNGFWSMTGSSANDIYLLRSQTILHYDGSSLPTEITFGNQVGSYWTDMCLASDGLLLVGPLGTVSKHVFPTQETEGGFSSLMASGPRVNLWNQRITPCGEGFLIYGWGQVSPTFEPLLYFDGTIPVRFPVMPDDFGSARETSVYAESINCITMTWWSETSGFIHSKAWDGHSWSDAEFNYPFGLIEHWKSPTGVLYAVNNGSVWKRDKTDGWKWILEYGQLPEDTWINCLWGKTDSELYIGLSNGTIMRYNGSQWSTEATGSAEQVRAISGYANSIYAVGDKSLAVYRSGSTWKAISGVEDREENHFSAMAPTTNGVYAISNLYQGGSRIYHFATTAATVAVDNLSDGFSRMCTTSSGTVYAFSASGNVITTSPVPADRFTGMVNTDATDWVSLGDSGVSLKFAEHRGEHYAAAWKTESAPTLFITPDVPNNPPASQKWTILQNIGYQHDTNLPQAYIRVNYSDDDLPSGLTPDIAALYRQDGYGWVALPSRADEGMKTIETKSPTDCSVWAIARSPEFEEPLNPVTLIEFVEAFSKGEVTYLDLFQRCMTWMQPN